MVTRFKFKNCFAFNERVEMTLRTDMRTKKFYSNIIEVNNNLNIMKSIAIYGPNNTGKTSFINCVKAIKTILENKGIHLYPNIFTESTIAYEAISFVYNGKEYNYEYKFDCANHSYIFEKMTEIIRDQYNNESENLIFVKETIMDKKTIKLLCIK